MAASYVVTLIMLSITQAEYEVMLHALQAVYPQEGCGLLAGIDGRVQRVYPIDNIDQSKTTFTMRPVQLVEAMFEMEASGRDLLAIYHSHPHSRAWPSPTDIALAHYPTALHVIVSLMDLNRPVMRAFQIHDGRVFEQTVNIV